MRVTLVCILMLLGVRLASQPAPAPAGWTAECSGANWVYSPTNIAAGRTFAVTIEPIQSLNGQSVDGWLASHFQTDISRRGKLFGTPIMSQNANGAWIRQQGFHDSQGVEWVAIYTAAPRPNGGVQCSAMVTNVPAGEAFGYVHTAGIIVAGGHIAAVLHEGRGQSTATGYAYIESADVLLTDGWAYLGLTTPPEYLDETASKQRESSKWHRWKSSGNDILIETGGQWTKLDAERVRPLPAGAAMSITLTHRNSTSFGGMGSYNTSATITLASNGQYQRSSGVIAGTGTVQAGGGFSGGAGSFQNQNERRTAASGGNGSVTATSRSRGSGDPNLAGNYKVTGYTLELDGAGGAVERVLAFYPFSDNNRVYINGVTYDATGRR